MVNSYLYPSLDDTGKGPTRSTRMRENHCCGTRIGCMEAASCLVTLALVQSWQSLTHSVMSLFTQDQTTLSLMILLV